MVLVIDRYERMASSKLVELKKLQRIALDGGPRDNRQLRITITQYEEQLMQGLEQILQLRTDIDPTNFEAFDLKIEPIRRQIQTSVKVNRSLPQLQTSSSFYEADEENPYEVEAQRHLQESARRENEMRQLAEDARMKAEGTKKIQKEMEDLEQIFAELAKIVHEQHDAVDSIEEQVERATEDVKRGNDQLKKAVKSKAAKTPIVAGVVGGLALGGPVGLAAGSGLAGIAAGVGGIFAGIYTGRIFKRAATQE
ncbi:unnamed protein product [Caenorhabditis bovis]|uniref:t-SNARE coiled-coil homology domain-containing protein n=1 Tax=Caenorhabditis bovis TaxID=2654633 RepID=A0A8S1FAP7_9PELO|nr:unnamed protein product [Caenorhabditis bovis]